ncbi:cation:proton antiporter [Amycolatopsis sp. A133]|uniref:cation:proton antiporter domain-containing protein n=1 Tax=Amycolatopsis sp. A133 TaxID=3064472 RepID=UPI0027FA6D14|nr:cation:proton antiporter [Amycolatopsis sp. A133]MDQ7808744.1 cation:proton antiporter [Amycolatopsis sp. A133]
MNSLTMLLDVAAILLAARIAGRLAVRIGQPAVVGEIAAGVLLAAVMHGTGLTQTVLPGSAKNALHAIATVGLVLFMFTVGHEWDGRHLRGRAAAGIALGSAIVPFALGAALAAWLAATTYHPADPVVFVLFLGAAMSITALPVLARIVTDRGLQGTTIGGLAIGAAAVVDVLAWVALAAIVTLGGGSSAWQMLLAVPYVLLLFVVVRPLLHWALRRRAGGIGFGTILAGLFVSAAATEWLGLHFVFGAFLFGALLPGRDDPVVRQQVDDIARFCRTFLLPIFFVVAALDVDLSGVGLAGAGELVLILLVAFAGKAGGAYLGARVCGLPKSEAGPVAALMNARGVTEIVVLQVGLQLGVLDTRLYSLMVVMALITTAATGPLLGLLRKRHRVAELPEPSLAGKD